MIAVPVGDGSANVKKVIKCEAHIRATEEPRP